MAHDFLASQRPRWTYRPDLDGLRALAILLVIGEHFSVKSYEWIRGGLGVDLFFVLSGFLITSILLKDYHAGAFSLRDFYARRIRRLFPVLCVVCVLTVLGGWWWLGRDGLAWIGENIVYASSGTMNLPFATGNPHFAIHPRLVPLAPLWSLALEEQFYLMAPWLLLGVLHLKRWRLWGGVFFGTLLIGSWTFHHLFINDIGKTYYNPLARSWELLIGVVLALLIYDQSAENHGKYHHYLARIFKRGGAWLALVVGVLGLAGDMTNHGVVWVVCMGLMALGVWGISWKGALSHRVQESESIVDASSTLSFVGLSLILGALFMVPLSAYPLTLAAIPLTLGTAMLITAGPRAWFNRVCLANPILVAMGRRSYALYLIHYPIYSLEVIRTRALVTDPGTLVTMVTLTGVLTLILYRWVEQPARQAPFTGRWFMAMVLCGLMGWGLWMGFGPTVIPSLL